MQFAFLIIPLGLFFAAYKVYDLFIGIQVLIAAMVAMLLVEWLLKRTVSKMHLVSTGLAIVLGGVSVAFRDAIFLQWKVSIVNWLMAVVFIGSHYIGEKPVLLRVIDNADAESAKAATEPDGDASPSQQEEPPISESDLRLLNMSWGVFFALIGFANLYVAYTFSNDTWVNFKVFGILGMTAGFVVLQLLWMWARLARSKPS